MTDPTWALGEIMAGRDLTRDQTEELFGQLMDGRLSEAQKAGLLVGLATKGETPQELAGAATAMRSRVVRIPVRDARVIDTCGTGGDGKGTFNVSTAAAIVAAAAGAKVAKHGNRSVSSRSGSADVLEALGVPIETDPAAAGKAVDEIGIAFLFAPGLHPAMREAMPVRRALGVRTAFNLLGPLTNPAGARFQLLGVYGRNKVRLVAEVLAELGAEHALVVHGHDGLDEISTTAATSVAEVRGGEVTATYELEPEAFGIARAAPSDLVGGEPVENARAMESLLAGAEGPLADIVAVNAGAALYVAGVAESIEAGVGRARAAIADGAASRVLEAMRSGI